MNWNSSSDIVEMSSKVFALKCSPIKNVRSKMFAYKNVRFSISVKDHFWTPCFLGILDIKYSMLTKVLCILIFKHQDTIHSSELYRQITTLRLQHIGDSEEPVLQLVNERNSGTWTRKCKSGNGGYIYGKYLQQFGCKIHKSWIQENWSQLVSIGTNYRGWTNPRRANSQSLRTFWQVRL